MNARLLSLALLAAGLVGVASPLAAQERAAAPARSTEVAATDPARQIEDLARRFRAGDVAGLVQGMVPPSQWAQIRLAYDLKRLEPTRDKERAEFAEQFERLIAPDAVDRLMAEIEPKLEEARPQAAGALLMGFGAMQMAVASPESKLSEAQRAMLRDALPGIQRWASGTDFLDSATLRDALSLLADAARSTGVGSIDQLKALPLDGALDRAGTLLTAAKQAVLLYGIDLDAVADSLHVEVLDVDGDSARVRATVTLFDAPVWNDFDLVLVEGRWYGKQAAVRWKERSAEDVEG